MSGNRHPRKDLARKRRLRRREARRRVLDEQLERVGLVYLREPLGRGQLRSYWGDPGRGRPARPVDESDDQPF